MQLESDLNTTKILSSCYFVPFVLVHLHHDPETPVRPQPETPARRCRERGTSLRRPAAPRRRVRPGWRDRPQPAALREFERSLALRQPAPGPAGERHPD